MTFPFTKMEGAGNDFIVVQGEDQDWASLAPQICARHFGIGSDGILVALPSSSADVRMRMYNPDGTEDDCGNGLRCLALYALRRGLVPGAEFTVQTLSGMKEVRVEERDGPTSQVAANMGQAALSVAAIPALFSSDTALRVPLQVDGETLEVCSLWTGTAHTVIFQMPDEDRFLRLSPQIEHHPLYPERTSILWTEMMEPDRARVRIWERGVGETLACGTGACAVAVASHVTGRTGNQVSVVSRGGTLRVDVAEDLSFRLTGPAAFVFEGNWAGASR